jgi:iron complex outermembrane receptor protein
MYASTVGLEGIQDYDSSGNTVGSATFIRIASDANPNLLPEEADNLNVGLIWSPTNDFQAKLDYWSIDYTNKITKASAQGVVQRTPNATNVVRVSGTLAGVVTPYFNASSVDTDGLDIELAYAMDTNIGQLSLGLNASHMLSYDIPIAGVTTDVVGLFNHDNFASSLPETKAVLSANLINGDHSAAVYYRHIASYKTTRAVGASGTALGFTKDIGNFDTLDLQYNFTISTSESEEIKLTAGIKNALDEDVPMFADSTNWSYDSRQHDPRGRIFSVGFKYSK